MANDLVQNVTEKPLNAKQLRAAILTAEDDLSDEKIAAECGTTRTTLNRWREIPGFKEAVADHVAELERQMLRLAIARKRYRVGRLNDLEAKLWEVIEERADDRETRDAAGGETGLIVKDVKAVGAGRDAQLVDVFQVDTGVIREIRALHEQAAKELGQWSENVNLNGALTSTVELVGVAAEDV